MYILILVQLSLKQNSNFISFFLSFNSRVVVWTIFDKNGA